MPDSRELLYGSEALVAALVERGLIDANDAERARSAQRTLSGSLSSLLVRSGAISEQALVPVLAQLTGIGQLSTADEPTHGSMIDAACEHMRVPLAWFVQREALPWEAIDGSLHIACRDPVQPDLREIVQQSNAGAKVVWHFAGQSHLEELRARLGLGQAGASASDRLSQLRELAEEAPVVEYVNGLFSRAVDESASDLHIEPQDDGFNVRLRIDGVMRDLHFMPRTQFDAVVSRIKLIAGLDIAERRLPQDGRLSTRAGGVAVDLRVSVIPGVKGESVVIRFLPTSANRVRMESLGLALDHFDLFNDWLDEPNGIVLVTGPTGSGKTTTLYAALDRANDGKRKIVTVEDPVEFRMPGITQIQVQPEIGYSFAQALRAVLRHDPDVILIGEIRDRETAAIATQAALTGHLVLATLHTNDALGAIPRLVDMGVEPFLLGATLRGVMAQRLVRRLCIRCAAADPNPVVPDEWGHWVKQHPESASAAQWRKAVGCTACGNTGYRGRLAIYEFVEVTDALKRAISKGEVEGSQRWRERLGARSLLQDGLLKAAAGVTSVEEAVRVAGQSAEPL